VAEARGAGRESVPALVQRLGLEPVAKRLVRELSFGYRQRVGLAAALAGETRVVLLDETLNGLDPRASRLAREVLADVAKAGATILMSTHLLGVAERLCTRLVFIDKGKRVHDLAGAELDALVAAGPGALEELYLSLVGEERA
jgi:ABC-2 type transport system ATP-binding protein